jgi:hypothetical protein
MLLLLLQQSKAKLQVEATADAASSRWSGARNLGRVLHCRQKHLRHDCRPVPLDFRAATYSSSSKQQTLEGTVCTACSDTSAPQMYIFCHHLFTRRFCCTALYLMCSSLSCHSYWFSNGQQCRLRKLQNLQQTVQPAPGMTKATGRG